MSETPTQPPKAPDGIQKPNGAPDFVKIAECMQGADFLHNKAALMVLVKAAKQVL